MNPSSQRKLRTADDVRTGHSVEALERAVLDNLFFIQARFLDVATRNDHYLALAYAVRDRLLHRWINTTQTYYDKGSRTVCYLSAEFLLGPQLRNNLISLGAYDEARRAVANLRLDLDALLEQEEKPGLGNGGLDRLAACYLDSLARLQIAAIGYGIRYEFGIFDQQIRDGWQVEVTDKWLHLGNPWEIARPEIAFGVKFGGHTEIFQDEEGHHRTRWVPERIVKGIASDTPMPGYGVNTVNLLRLWKAEACESFDFQAFNSGDYYSAVNEKLTSENLTKVLYPNDEPLQGKILRLQQQYFFVSCYLPDMIRIYFQQRGQNLHAFHEKYAVQLNDTHPAIAVAELMRLLVDEYLMPWEPAWEVTRKTFAYTNRTLMPEALEKWSLPLFCSLLPRHLEIIYEINQRFLDEVRLLHRDDEQRLPRLSLIEEGGEQYVRMAHLACVGSYAINGVARLHTELLQTHALRDFYVLWPEKFSNKNNGATPRRFLALSNPRLARLLSDTIGKNWITDLEHLSRLETFADDTGFRERWQQVKQDNKRDLAAYWKHPEPAT